ncbi:MAG TPA: phosphotransferase [Chloroflexota bacterium]|nr:phosphotransferase [Chloroflexota bacterium]
MDTPNRMEALAREAERLVRCRVGQKIRMSDPSLIAKRERSLVMRCTVTGWDGVASVVVKRNEGDDARGFTDWAGLQFLSTLEAAEGVAPRLYAGALEERLVVMEDLGHSRSLADVLDAGDAAPVVGVLQALASSMARLVTATAPHEAAYQRLRASLPGAEGLGRQHEARRWLAALDRVARWADALDVRLPTSFAPACEHIAAVYAEPGAYLAFSHGDPAPSNNHLAGDRVSLVDFEYAGYRHALYDLTAWETLCPLPPEWVVVMEHAFTRAAEASSLGGMPVHEKSYREARATICAYRSLAMLTWFSPGILRQDRGWTPGWTQREALISTTLRLYRLSVGVAVLAPLAELGEALAEATRTRWPELGDGLLRWPGLKDTP